MELEYKYVVRQVDGCVLEWKPGDNCQIKVPVLLQVSLAVGGGGEGCSSGSWQAAGHRPLPQRQPLRQPPHRAPGAPHALRPACPVSCPVCVLQEEKAIAEGVLVRDVWDGSIQDIELEVVGGSAHGAAGLQEAFTEEQERAAVQSAVSSCSLAVWAAAAEA